MKRRLIIGAFLAAVVKTLGADETVKYEPTEIQTLRLQVKVKNAQIAWRDYQDAAKDVMNEVEKIKADQKWPKEVSFDLASMTFKAPKTEAKVEDKKP